VLDRPTTTTISAAGITYGQTDQVTVTTSSPLGTPTGTVTLSVDGGSPLTQALSGGSAKFTIPGLHAGGHSLAATYDAQGKYAASSATGAAGVSPYSFNYKIGNDAQTYGVAANLAADLPATIDTGVNGEI